MLYGRRKRFAKQSKTIGRIFSRISKNPNAWTFLSLLSSILTASFIINNMFAHAALFLAITIFLDVVDGSVARFMKRETRKGAYFDTIIDRYVEGIIIFSLFFAAIPDFALPVKFLILIYLFGSLMTSYAKAACAEKMNKRIAGGIVERAERMVLLFLGIAFAITNPVYLSFVILLLAILTNLTALQRIYISLRR